MSESPATSTALAKPPPADISSGVFSGIAAFEAAQRMAHALCSSSMVPTEYRGQQGLSNSLIALEIAARMGLSPLVVMQNMTPIHGRPSWSSSFLIATVNASGRFTPLRFVFDDKEQPGWCFAVARDKATGELLEGQKITIEMAKREGWWSRRDRNGNETSKWPSMTGQMLRYRAASFWVRVFCPEISLGLMTQEEALEVEAVTVSELEGAATAAPPAVASTAPAVPEPIIRPLPAVQHEPAADGATHSHESSPPIEAARPPAETTTREKRAQSSRPRKAAPATPTEGGGAESPVAAAESRVAASESDGDHGQEAPRSDSEPPSPATAENASEPVDLVASGIKEIPRLSTLEALDAARTRVSKLLAAGRITDDGAERLWAVIDKRRLQLQTAAAGETP